MRSVLVLPLLVVAAAANAGDLFGTQPLDPSVIGGIPKSPPMPEPASIAALAVGAIGVFRRYKKA